MQRHRLSRQGFTLVELSIVLVVIGLLIGGVLVGQSLIESAKINAQVRQIQQLDIAVNNFIGKYKHLPGDSPLLPIPGNGDNILNDLAGTLEFYSGEYINFWNQLITTELPSLYKHNNIVYSITPGFNCPQAIIGVDSTILGMTSYGWRLPQHTPMWHIRNKFSAAHLFNGDNETGQASPLTVGEAMSLDSKIDDGNAITGDVRASDGKRTGQLWVSGATEQGCVQAGDNSKYDINQETVGASERPCGSVIKMQIGN